MITSFFSLRGGKKKGFFFLLLRVRSEGEQQNIWTQEKGHRRMPGPHVDLYPLFNCRGWIPRLKCSSCAHVQRATASFLTHLSYFLRVWEKFISLCGMHARSLFEVCIFSPLTFLDSKRRKNGGNAIREKITAAHYFPQRYVHSMSFFFDNSCVEDQIPLVIFQLHFQAHNEKAFCRFHFVSLFYGINKR